MNVIYVLSAIILLLGLGLLLLHWLGLLRGQKYVPTHRRRRVLLRPFLLMAVIVTVYFVIKRAKETQPLKLGDAASFPHVAFSPRGDVLAFVKRRQRGYIVALADVATEEIRAEGQRHKYVINDLAFSPDGTTVAAAGNDGAIMLYDTSSGEQKARLQWELDPVTAVAFSSGNTLVAAGTEGIVVGDISSSAPRTRVKLGDVIWSISIARSGGWMAAAGPGSTVTLWDLRAGGRIDTLAGHDSAVYAVALSPDDKILAAGSHDGTITLWDVSTKGPLETLVAHQRLVRSLDFSPDGARLVSGGADGRVILWDVTPPNARAIDKQHNAPVWSVSFSPVGSYVASASSDQSYKLTRVDQMDRPPISGLMLALGCVMCAVAFVAVLISVWRWQFVVRHYDRITLNDVLNSLSYSLRARQRKVFDAALLALPVMAAWSALFPYLEFPTFVWVNVTGISLAFIMHACLPPGVLLLTTSTRETISLFKRLQRSAGGLRVVALLNPAAGATDQLKSIQFDNLRTIDDEDWQSVVHPLMDRVPIAVVDARHTTPAVLHETERMLEPQRVHKTLFLAFQDGHAPSIDAVAATHDDALLVSIEQLPKLLVDLSLVAPKKRAGLTVVESAKILTRIHECEQQKLDWERQRNAGTMVEAFFIRETGLQSYCESRLRRDEFLPRTDWVFIVGKTAEPILVSWSDMMACVGHHLRKLDDLKPERWVFQEAPTSEEIADLEKRDQADR